MKRRREFMTLQPLKYLPAALLEHAKGAL